MDLKMVVIGRNKEKESLAEEILETVWQSALEMFASSEMFSSVRLEVDKILVEVRKIPCVKTTKVAKHCIIVTLRYSSWDALLGILEYMESKNIREHFENISDELGYICGVPVALRGNVTVESLKSAMKKHEIITKEKSSETESFLQRSQTEDPLQKEVQSTEGASEASINLKLPEPDETVQKEVPSTEGTSLAAIFLQLPKADKTVQKEKTEYPSAAGLQPPIEGLQTSEIEDLEQKGRIIIRKFNNLYDSITYTVKRQAMVNMVDLYTTTQIADAVTTASLYYQVEELLTENSELFVSVLPMLEILSSVAIPFKRDYSEKNYRLVLLPGDSLPSLCLKFFAIATYLNIRIFVLCRNCHGHLQWFFFSPLFEFENQPNIAVSYITLYLPSKKEIFAVCSKQNTPEPKAFGLLGLYLTALSVKVSKNLECHRKVCEIDQATVEINSEVSKLVNVCKELISKRNEKNIGITSALTFPLLGKLILVGLGLAALFAEEPLGLVAVGAAAVGLTYAEGKGIEKKIKKMMIILKEKKKDLLKKQMEINLFLGIASADGVLDKIVVRKSSFLDVPTKLKLTAEHVAFEQRRPYGLRTSLETLPKAKHILEGSDVSALEDAMKKMTCKQRVISNIFRGSFDDSERMVTLENTGLRMITQKP